MKTKKKWKKIVLRTLMVLIGLPVLLVSTLLAWCYYLDQTNGTIVSSGLERRYVLYVPKSYDRSKPTPLVISLHPAATWGALQMYISRWNDLADQYGFIVVYPDGTGAFFGRLGPGPQVWPGGPRTLPRDLRFISDLIDKLEAEYNIDPRRIYSNGMSNGGAMAIALSCKLPDRIAAVGAVAAAQTLERDPCVASGPAPTVVFHGTADKLTRYQGGKSPLAPGTFVNLPDWTAHVAQRNQCKGDPSETRVSPSVRRLAYSNCAENADVVLYTIEGGGHTWPGGKHLAEWIAGQTTDEISASRVMWDFYMQHPLPK